MKKYLEPLKNMDKLICFAVFLLMILSFLMIESTVYDEGFVWHRTLTVQIVAYAIGIIMMLVVIQLNYNMFEGLEKYLYIVAVVGLLTVYIPGLGLSVYGTRAWLKIGNLTTVQPSEFVKILFVLIMAGYLERNIEEMQTFKGIFKAFLVGAPIIAIVLKEDLGSALVYMVVWLIMIFFAGANYKVLLKAAACVVIAIPIAYRFLDDYQKERIIAFLHPDNLSLSGNYQVYQSKVAIGNGGFFGQGLFKGTQKTLDFIPVQQSDFIFSVVCEELGFIGGLAVIGLYALMLLRFARIVKYTKSMYGRLIVIGFLGMFLFQIFENIAMTLGIMPVTGITLPFLSGGGTSVIASLMALGVVLNIGATEMKPVSKL